MRNSNTQKKEDRIKSQLSKISKREHIKLFQQEIEGIHIYSSNHLFEPSLTFEILKESRDFCGNSEKSISS